MNGPTEAVAIAIAAAAFAASTALGTYLARRDPADRDLLRLARKATPMIPAPIANDERSPDWCHRHGCHRSQCPGPN
ncbi:hypothetical protein AB0D33_38130 [Streptomyces sp. NPDC048404]|uniref:hypothetical protein n=1 Tax=unclassified Streptomyces TaxID=2593676 RepID=UPI00343B2C1E